MYVNKYILTTVILNTFAVCETHVYGVCLILTVA